ncbi:hypothetical protein HaLaN_26078, partial [Haematococcus lacustris]
MARIQNELADVRRQMEDALAVSSSQSMSSSLGHAASAPSLAASWAGGRHGETGGGGRAVGGLGSRAGQEDGGSPPQAPSPFAAQDHQGQEQQGTHSAANLDEQQQRVPGLGQAGQPQTQAEGS